MERLAAKEEELRVAAGTLVLFSSGGALAHPLGVAPEIRANCVPVGSNLNLLSCIGCGFLQQLDSYRVSVFNRLLEMHRQLKEQLVAKEEEFRFAAGIFSRMLFF